MNKKILFGLFAVAVMLFATSCQKEDLTLGEETVVSFTLEQAGIETRAYSDGTNATTLTYAVYEANSTKPLITSDNEVSFSGKTAKVSLNLVTGKSYDIIFWADAPVAEGEIAPYTFDAGTQSITVNYEDLNSQDENRDAFFAAVTGLVVEGASQQQVKLTRPFAQLNIGATDAAEASQAGFTPVQSSVIVKNVYSTLNLFNGNVSGPVEATYNMAAIPGNEEAFPVANAKYLSMNYLLVGVNKELVAVGFTVSNGSSNITRTYSNVPVQRNFRTNIYGKILTSSADFDIEIDGGYKDDYDYKNVVSIANAEELNNAVLEDNDIVILGEDTYNLLKSTQGKTLTFIGRGNPENTIIKLRPYDGDGKYDGGLKGSKATFENLTIEADPNLEQYSGFGHCEATYKNCTIKNVYTLYGTSVFENCTFEVTGNRYNVWTWGANATFTKCTFNCDGKAVLVYGQTSESTITFTDCSFNDEGDISGKAAIETGNDYNVKYNIHINGCTVKGFDINPVGINTGTTLWANKNSMTADNLNVFINGEEVY